MNRESGSENQPAKYHQMPRHRLEKTVACALLLLISSAVLSSQPAIRVEPAPYRLNQIKLAPFSRTSGSFSPEIKKDSDFSAWNQLELSLLVTVEVSGKPGVYSSNRKVEVTAFEGRRLIAKQVVSIGALDEATGKYFVPVLLNGPFCQMVTIKARLIGQARSSSLERKLDFQCGE